MLKIRLLNITLGWVVGLALLLLLALALKITPVSSQNIQGNERPSTPSLAFTTTVGLNPASCATTDAITVIGPTNIVYCYTVKNTGDISFTRSTLTDSRFGPLLNNIFLVLMPGESLFFTVTIPVNQTTISTATWDAYDIESYTVDDTAPYNFIDISSFGMPILVGPDGAENVQTPNNFNIQLYNRNNHHLRVGMNGIVRQSATSGPIGPVNRSLPTSVIKTALVPFWDDLDKTTSGAIYHAMTGTAPNRSWIVQWDDVHHYTAAGNLTGTVTFQTVMTEGVSSILFQYADVNFGVPAWNGGQSATIGLQKNNSTGVQYSFNTASITNGMAIRFTPTFITATDSHTATVILLEPAIEMTATVGTTPGLCAITSSVVLPVQGGEVYYCYDVKNTGDITLTRHDLDDSELGSIFATLPLTLGPGQRINTVDAGFIITQFVTETAVNTAAWTAYNPGPTNMVSASSSVTLTLDTLYFTYLPAVRKGPTPTANLPFGLTPLFAYGVHPLIWLQSRKDIL
jgi:hypothetical protein